MNGTRISTARVNREFWRDRRVLITGHTGFKGALLALWVESLGAHVCGFSAGRPSEPSLYELARVGADIRELPGDVRDFPALLKTVKDSAPEVVIHMAAQPLVRRSYAEPRETYETNVMGTVNVLEAVRIAAGVGVLLNVTSDKCYENSADAVPADSGAAADWRGYNEDSPLGGDDPYSSSKGAAELVVAAYRRSFFHRAGATRVATVRAGNVIGGGDWGQDRLVPDVIRAALERSSVLVRNPTAVRPWQHVLNPLEGYLVLTQALWDTPQLAGAWNFGPEQGDARPVGWLVEQLSKLWPDGIKWEVDDSIQLPESRYLRLDSTRARELLGWRPPLDIDAGLKATIAWYRAYAQGSDMRRVTLEQIEAVGCC